MVEQRRRPTQSLVAPATPAQTPTPDTLSQALPSNQERLAALGVQSQPEISALDEDWLRSPEFAMSDFMEGLRARDPQDHGIGIVNAMPTITW